MPKPNSTEKVVGAFSVITIGLLILAAKTLPFTTGETVLSSLGALVFLAGAYYTAKKGYNARLTLALWVLSVVSVLAGVVHHNGF